MRHRFQNEVHDLYTQYPVYGYCRLTACLRRDGIMVNHKRVLRLMHMMKIRAIFPGPKTTVSHPFHKKYLYLLRSLQIKRPHQVWQVDITYLRIPHCFIYMNALIDVYSRFIVGWSLSNMSRCAKLYRYF